MIIRPYQESDFEQLRQLFHDTVRAINIRDYSPEQIAAWAPIDHAHERMQQALNENISYVVEDDSLIIGFADIKHAGYLDHIYTHKDHQGKGVATLLVKKLEDEMRIRNIKEITTEASITAQPFFERQGYSVIKENAKEYRGIIFKNYSMSKQL